MSWLCGLLVKDNYVDDAKDNLLVPPVRIGGGEPVAVAMGICCWVLDVFFFFFFLVFILSNWNKEMPKITNLIKYVNT